MPFIPLRPDDVAAMLDAVGAGGIDDLFAHVPAGLVRERFDLPAGASQLDIEREMAACAARNAPAVSAACFLGAGAYDHYTPPVVREILRRGELYTAYTPYQPEIAQGMLQALFEYQTMLARLLGMEIANASMYDGASAAWEAVLLAVRHTGRTRVLVDAHLNPRWRQVIATGAQGVELQIVEASSGELAAGRDAALLARSVGPDVAAVVVPNPDFFGRYADLRTLAEAVHAAGALLIACVAPMSLAIFETPGAMGCDVVCGEAQELGLPLSYGGPYLGYLAARKALVRRVPGRLVGMTVDAAGERAFTLTLQTREQHIRREKAVSNICTNQSLCAFAAGAYLAAMGWEGLRRCAAACLEGAGALRDRLAAIPGVEVFPGTYWREFVYRTPAPAARVCRELAARGILAGVPIKEAFGGGGPAVLRHVGASAAAWHDGLVLAAVTEKRTAAECEAYAAGLAEVIASYRG